MANPQPFNSDPAQRDKPEQVYAQLEFKMDANNNESSNIAIPVSIVSYKQNEPVPQGSIKLARQNSEGWYIREIADLPASGQRYLAKIRRESEESKPVSMSPKSLVTELCFIRKNQHKKLSLYKTEFLCVEGDGCKPDELTDKSWYEMCRSIASGHSFNLVATAYASEDDMQAGWIAPSLDTLCRRQKSRQASFTYFKIQSTPLTGLDQVDSMTYQVFANDTPIYFDGWPQEDTITAVDPLTGITLEFGLENLNFSGANYGEEMIRVEFDFYSGKKPLKTLSLERSYVALREVEPISITKDDIDFNWTGDYFIGKAEDGFKVNIWSTTDPNELAKRKKWFDQAGVQFEGRHAVSVIRPPLKPNPFYGLSIGLVDEYSRVKFTFSKAGADRILSWVKNSLRSVRVKDLNDGFKHPIVRVKDSDKPEGLSGIPNQDKICNW